LRTCLVFEAYKTILQMLSSKQKLKRERAENAIAAIMHATEPLEDKHFYNRAILLWQGVNKNERDRGCG